MILGFFVVLIISSLIVTFAFGIVMMVIAGVLAATMRIRVLLYPAMGVAFAAQVYFWGIWAAYCSSVAARWGSDAFFPPLYYLFALGACTSPIGWMSHKEMAMSKSKGEATGIQRGTLFYGTVAAVAFIVFSIWPAARQTVYGWIIG